jgi:CHAT domain-containing protein
MKFIIKQIVCVLCSLFLISANSISKEINSSKCSMPSNFLALEADDLIKLDKCFEEDKKVSFQNIITNPKTKNLKPSIINKIFNETALNHHTNEISDQNYERLFNASLKYIKETKFLKWFLYKEKTHSLIKFAENYFSKDELVTTIIFEYVINNRSDVKIDNLKKVIVKYLSPKKLNDLIIGSLSSSNSFIRQRSCNDIIYKAKKTSLENTFLLKIQEKVRAEDRFYIPCYFKILDQLKRNEEVMKFVKQNSYMDWNDEESTQIIDSYLGLNNDILSPEEFGNFYNKVKDENYYFYSAFINKIYPNTFQLEIKDRRKHLDFERCLITNLKDCILENQKTIYLNYALSNVMKIIDALNMDLAPFNKFLQEILRDNDVSLIFKGEILKTLDFDVDELRTKNQNFMFQLILKHKRDMYLKNAERISQSDQLSEDLDIMPSEKFRDVFNFKSASTLDLIYEDWFIVFVKQINNATSAQYFHNLNSMLFYFIMSENTEEGLAIVENALSRIEQLGVSKFREEYLQLLWHASFLEKTIMNGNPYEKIIRGINLTSKDKNDNSKKLLFEDLRIDYLREQNNLEEAFRFAEEKLKIEEEKAVRDLNKYADQDWKSSIILGPCVSALQIYEIKQNDVPPKHIQEVFEDYCLKNFDLFNKDFPMMSFLILDQILYREHIKMLDEKEKILDSSIIKKINSFLNQDHIDPNFKTVLSVSLKMHFNRTIESGLIKHPLDIKKIKFKLGKNSFLEEFKMYYDFYSLYKMLNNNKIKFSGLLKFINSNLVKRTHEHYMKSNNASQIFFNFITNKYPKKILASDNIEEYYKMRNLMKFSQSEKIISTKNSIKKLVDKTLFSNYTRDLTRKAFLVDALFFKGTNIEQQEHLRLELTNINKNIKKTSRDLKNLKINFNTISSLQNKLSDKDIVVDFHFHKQPAKLSILVIKKNSIDQKFIQNPDKLMDSVILFKNSIKPEINQDMFKYGHYIYKTLISDFVSQKTDNIYILPDKFLYALPFHALPMIEKNNSNLKEENKWLGLKYKISFLTTIIKNKSETFENQYNFFGVGDPIFEANNNTQTILGNLITNKRGLSMDIQGYQRLPNTALEIQSIASMNIFENTKILLGKNATETKIKKSKKIESASIISFATHGLVSGEMNSHSEPGLLMTKSNEINDNGYLTMTEISSLNLRSDLVILSACNTASSMSKNTSPFSGLASAFLSAGSNKVLASMWSVESKSTYLLMKSILTKIDKKKKNIKEAQFKGIKSFIKKYSQYKSPYFWGGFMLFGTSI